MDPMQQEEEYRKMMELGGQNAAMDPRIEQQMAQAKMMRAQAPQGRQAGNVYVAPHWAELAGGLAQNYVAGKKMDQATQSREKQVENTNAQNQMYMAALLRQAQATNPQQAQPQGQGPAGPGMQPPASPQGQMGMPQTPYGQMRMM